MSTGHTCSACRSKNPSLTEGNDGITRRNSFLRRSPSRENINNQSSSEEKKEGKILRSYQTGATPNH